MNLKPVFLSFEVALVTTACLFVLGLGLAYWLAYRAGRFKFFFETMVGMPLVLPPTVLGFYLLMGYTRLDQLFDIKLAFTFPGLVLASMVYSLPFMVQPLQAGFEGLPGHLREASFTLGKSSFTTLFRVLLPAMKPSLVISLVLCFAHTLGEFGVVLMVGGSIPSVTRVASIAIYEEVEALNYAAAHQYALVLFGLSFILLAVTYYFHHRNRVRQRNA